MKHFFSAVRLMLTLKCEHSTRLISESLDRDLSAVERWAIRLHYLSCWSCRRFGHQLRHLRQAMRQFPRGTNADQQGLSADATHRIQEAIRRSSPPN